MLKNAANSKKSRVGIFALILSALLLGVTSEAHAEPVSIVGTTGEGPREIVFDEAGNLYTANFSSNTISKITSTGESITAFGRTGTGPRGIAIDNSGNIYTSNFYSNTISKITPTGEYITAFANTGEYPYDIVIDNSGNIYTSNYTSRYVSKITPTGESITAFAESEGGRAGIAIDSSGNLYIANANQDSISKISPSGEPIIHFASTGHVPINLVVDQVGNIYTSNSGDFTVSKITPAGVSTILGNTGPNPYGITVDPAGNVYTSNLGNNTVTKITPSGISTTLATLANTPRGIAFHSGNIYTTNSSSGVNNVTKITLATVASGSAPNSKVITLPTGVARAAIPATAALPATTLNFGGTVPTAVTVVPVTTNPAPEESTPFISGSTKIVDIQITGTFTGSATVCLDGAETDQLFHYVGGKWEELPSRTYVPGSPGQVCGVTTSFSPFAAASTAAKTAAVAATAAASAAAKAAAEAAAAKREAEKQAARADITSKLKSAKDLTVDVFAKAEIPGITASNIAAVQAELLALPEASRTDINQVLKVAHKYEVVGNIGSDQVNNLQSNSFIEIGLIPATSKNKVALVAAVRKLPAASRDTYAEIKAAIDAATKEIQVRSDRLASIIARNAARYKK
jgi:streptogramin lyase